MIIEKYNTFFFHVPKTAGFSIEQFLLPSQRDHKIFDEKILFGSNSYMMTQHITYKESLQYRSKDFLDSQFKFAFFRNTWDRFCSAFFYLENFYLKQYGTFDNFVIQVCDKVHKYPKTNGWHFAKQLDWLYDDNKKICLDFIGEYENLDSHFKQICEKIGCEYKKLEKMNSSMYSKLNHRDILNDKNRKIIEEAYREEIEYFDFKF